MLGLSGIGDLLRGTFAPVGDATGADVTAALSATSTSSSVMWHRMAAPQTPLQAAVVAAAAVNKRTPIGKTADDDESWVELGAPASRSSICSSVDVLGDTMVRSFLFDSTRTSRKQSPKAPRSPNVEMAKELMPPGRYSDWIWDWSASRPEAVPPREYARHRSGNKASNANAQNAGDSLTTPPNSPVPSDATEGTVLSWRHTSVVKHDLLSVKFVLGVIVSNVLTFVLGACVGFCVAKRVHTRGALTDVPTD